MDRRGFLKITGGVSVVALGGRSAAAGAARRGQERPRVRIWSPGDNGTVADWNRDPILAAVEEATGGEIELTKIGFDTYLDQINAAIASGEVPDIIATVDHGQRTVIGQMVRDGVVAPFTGDIAAAAPNVLAQYQANPTLEELKIDGEIYMKPVSWADDNGPGFGIIHVRKDKLDAYGLEPPDTFEQYFAFLKAAKEDGSTGVVFGAGGEGGLGGAVEAFTGAYGVPAGGWVRTDGGWGFWAVQPGVRDGLLLFRRMVAEELVDPASWEITDSPRDTYVAGRPYSMIWNGGGHVGRIQNDMDLAGVGAQEWTLAAPDAGAGSRGYLTVPSFFGGTFLGNLEGNDPVAAATVINFLSSEEGYKLTALGLPDRDYEERDGQITLLPGRAADGFPTEAGDTGAHPLASAIVSWVPQEWQDFALLYGKDEAFATWYGDMWDNQRQYLLESFGQLTATPAWSDFQSTSTELVTRGFLEIVRSGDEAEAGARFDEFVTAWRGAGGDEAQSEMSEALTGLYG